MREMLFKGKRLDNGEWIEGNLFKAKRYSTDIWHYYILPIGVTYEWGYWGAELKTWEVDPDTVREYTGLRDKNGKPIYEGHIVKCNHSFFTAEAEKAEAKKPRKSYGKEIEKTAYGDFQCRYWRNYVVSFHDGRIRGQNGSDTCYLKQSYIRNHEVEIIGNIHDNPELLEVR